MITRKIPLSNNPGIARQQDESSEDGQITQLHRQRDRPGEGRLHRSLADLTLW
jgi:hypothetical protein